MNFWANTFPKVCVINTWLLVDHQELFYFCLWVLEVQKRYSLIPQNFCSYRAIILMKKIQFYNFWTKLHRTGLLTYCAWQVLTFDAFRLELFASFMEIGTPCILNSILISLGLVAIFGRFRVLLVDQISVDS